MQNAAVEASAKLVLLKLNLPLTQFPELAREILQSGAAVRIPESVFIVRTVSSPEELCAKLTSMIDGKGSVLVSAIGFPAKLDGSDVSLNQVMDLLKA